MLGYNLGKAAVGEALTVAHGGWKSSAHSRYERFANSRVLSMPAAMVGLAPAEPAAPRPEEMERTPRAPPVLPQTGPADEFENDDDVASGFGDELEEDLTDAAGTQRAQPEDGADGGLQFVPLAAFSPLIIFIITTCARRRKGYGGGRERG